MLMLFGSWQAELARADAHLHQHLGEQRRQRLEALKEEHSRKEKQGNDQVCLEGHKTMLHFLDNLGLHTGPKLQAMLMNSGTSQSFVCCHAQQHSLLSSSRPKVQKYILPILGTRTLTMFFARAHNGLLLYLASTLTS